ncbi:ABC transporter substrate-binding protein [Streptomyces durmitorensis]|uniref:ABC transporter substrate-binding protein n=1 Tax=Streptomyces durmitorensis TaxID=319947 RepID=A0ABY4Q3J7_9ACTN|nr:ABC transporter substrate-binding protein [Streptomyces durmitorensis]UQT59944.1 ABC transporter substrate-binding protein [Streptomyces durmitorensis]
MRSARIAAAVVGAAALGLTGCGGAPNAGGPAASGGRLADGKSFTLAMPSDPGTLDPAMTVMATAIQADRFLYDPLIHVARDGGVTAGLAAKWEADTTTARFTLRPGLTCADGAPLTARDVAANIAFVADPKNRSPLAGLYVNPGATVKADNETREITVTSKIPDAFLLRNIGMVPIVCGKGMDDRGSLAKGQHGTGMFTLTEAVPGDHYTLTRREDYTWGPGTWQADQKGLPDKVHIRVVANETTAANLLLSGELNAASLGGPDQQRLLGRGQFHADATSARGEMWFNQAPGRPTRDEPVRRALAKAADLGDIGKVLTAGTGKPSRGLLTVEPKPCKGDAVSGNLPAHDVRAAKSLLDKAGWKESADNIRVKNGKRLTLTLVYPSQIGQPAASAAELVQKAWQDVGADVTIKGVDNTGINQVVAGNASWDAAVLPLGLALPPQLRPFVSGPKPPDGTNFAHIENDTYAKLADEASRMPGGEGCPTWSRAEEALITSVDVVPFVDAVVPTFGAGARFELSHGSITPSSVRMYGG